MLAIDHVIAVVDDLDGAAALLLEHHGLASTPGGRHPGHGTGNRIVPLGGSYLELMAVLDPDEAATSPMGRWARDRATPTVEVAAVCIRTDDITEIAAALGEDPLAMSRETPDGRTLAWQLVGLTGMLDHGWPFFIQWHTDEHPGMAPAAHEVEPIGLAAVSFPEVPGTITRLLTSIPGVSVTPGRMSAQITTTTGVISL